MIWMYPTCISRPTQIIIKPCRIKNWSVFRNKKKKKKRKKERKKLNKEKKRKGQPKFSIRFVISTNNLIIWSYSTKVCVRLFKRWCQPLNVFYCIRCKKNKKIKTTTKTTTTTTKNEQRNKQNKTTNTPWKYFKIGRLRFTFPMTCTYKNDV